MPPAADTVVIGGISLLRALSSIPSRRIVVSRRTDDIVRYSRDCDAYYVLPDPITEPNSAVSQLIAIAADMPQRPVLYYGDDVSLLLVSRYRHVLQSYYRLLLPDPALVETCADKERFGTFAVEHDLPVPRTLPATAYTGARPPALEFPVVVKPRLSTGKAHIRHRVGGKQPKALVVRDSAALDSTLAMIGKHADDFVIQEYIGGGEQSIYSFHCYADEAANPLGYFVGRKIRTYPSFGGASTYIELVNAPEVASLGTELVKALGVRGPVKIDIKRDPDRNCWLLLELNLRYTLWNHLGAYCGVNLLEIAYRERCALPQRPSAPYRTDIAWMAPVNDLRTVMKCYWPNRELTLSGWLRSLKRPILPQLFTWRDPVPSIIQAGRLSRSLLRKGWSRRATA